MDRNIKHQDSYGYGLFSVIEKSAGILIGDCGLEHMELDGELVTELGYDFRSDYWNQGLATEAASAVRDHAFNELRIPSLISLIRIGNEASKRVSEKIGMRFIDEIIQSRVLYWKYAITHRSDTQIYSGLTSRWSRPGPCTRNRWHLNCRAAQLAAVSARKK